MIADASESISDEIEFEQVNDLIGMKVGVYVEELGRRKILVSPAIFSLLRTDKAATIESLKVIKNGEERWVMDVGGDL